MMFGPPDAESVHGDQNDGAGASSGSATTSSDRSFIDATVPQAQHLLGLHDPDDPDIDLRRSHRATGSSGEIDWDRLLGPS